MKLLLKILSLVAIITTPLFGEKAFTFNITRFYWGKNVSEVEVHYVIPHNLLSFQNVEGKLSAPFRLYLKVENINTGDILCDTISRVTVIPSYKEADKRNLLAIEQFKIFSKPGDYNMTLSLVDINTGRKVFKSEIFHIDTLKDKLTISDIELATFIEKDTTDSEFTKNGLKVMPNPSGIYGEGRSMLYFYIEIYNLKDDTIPYEITYTMLDDSENVVSKIGPNKKQKAGKSTTDIDVGALNLVALKPGFYTISIKVLNGKDYALSKTHFQIKKQVATVKEKNVFFSEEEKKYYDKIEYIASEKELAYEKTLSDSGKYEFLKRFWLKRDPDQKTPENECLIQFIERLKYVDDHFSTPFKKGYYTDRGRIYIRYGEPNTVEKHYYETCYRPYEVWEYYLYGGYRFVFSDIGGDNEFILVYSSTYKEPSWPNWKRYCPKDIGVMHGE